MKKVYIHSITTPYPISTNRYYRSFVNDKFTNRIFSNVTTLSEVGRLFKQKVKLTNLRLKPTNDEIALDITIHPKQKKDGSSFSQIIDLDNGLKCILDSLIGIVYHDDKQVKELHANYGVSTSGGGATVLVSKFVS